MFGNKFAAEELAKSFHKNISDLKPVTKEASSSKVAQVNPEDFLIEPAVEEDVHGSALDDKISGIDSYAEDKCEKCGEASCACDGSYADDACGKCGKAHDMESACGDMGSDVMVVPLMADDMDYLVDSRAEYVLQELEKISTNLRNQGKGFAADMVSVTAMEIRNESIEKAAKKLEVVTSLEKMAKDSYAEGDRLTGDVILTSIQNIKNG